jgi:ferric-dicitrate binding protein FerR (iron transport regulator)
MVMRPANQIFETGYGETLEIVLEDASRVTLNANSKLTWYSNWRNRKERKVELEGEAFFEVNRKALNPGEHSEIPQGEKKFMPFMVITPELTVNVLGTSFNVLARRQKTDVFLKSGEVLLTMNDKKELDPENENLKNNFLNRKPEPDSIYLAPGDHVSFSGASRLLDRYTDQPSQSQASWIDGFLVYDNDPLQRVLEDLEDIYGKSFKVGDSTLLDRKVNLGLPYKDWETVSGLMTLSLEIEMIESDGHIIVRKKQGK